MQNPNGISKCKLYSLYNYFNTIEIITPIINTTDMDKVI